MPGVIVALAIAPHTGIRLAEIGFLLVLIAGVWMVAAELLGPTMTTFRTTVAGVALAVGALLLIIATHWGHFG